MLLLTFTLNQTKFGIPLEEVEYIVEDVPNVETSMISEHIRGVATLRGEVVPIYNLMSRLGFGEVVNDNAIVVVNYQGKRLGLEVGDIDGIKYMEDFILAEIPPIIQKEEICIKHMVPFQGEIILVLNIGYIAKGCRKI